MRKEQKYQFETSKDFAGSSKKNEGTPQCGVDVPSAGTHEGGQRRDLQQADLMPLKRASREQAASQASQATKTVQESPFLNALIGNRVLATFAVELYRDNVELQQENEVFAEKAEKHDRKLQQTRESYYRTKDPDTETQREKWRVKQAKYRERKKQAAQQKEQKS